MRHKYALRRAFPIIVAAVLLTGIFVDVVAAGVKAMSGRQERRPIRHPAVPSRIGAQSHEILSSRAAAAVIVRVAA